MKIGEIVQRIQSLYSKGVQSDDTRLMSRHIYNKMLSVRAKLISQEYNKKQRISQWNYQTLPCVKLQEVSSHNCSCVPIVGCKILRSINKLPKPLQGLSGNLIQSVSTIDRSIKIDELSLNAAKFQKGNKFTKKRVNYFIQDEYLYISSPTKIEMVQINGLFEDPIEAKTFDNACGNGSDCIDYQDEDFPIENEMIDSLIELCLVELIQLFSQEKQDILNNSSDDNNQVVGGK